MRRGSRRWGPAIVAVLIGVFTAGVAPATGVGSSSGVGTDPGSTVVRLKVDAVAYHLTGRTASGLPCRPGVVAVDPSVIPLGTRMMVPGYGLGIAADVGTAIKGRIIDLWMPTDAAARRWGRHTVVISVYR